MAFRMSGRELVFTALVAAAAVGVVATLMSGAGRRGGNTPAQVVMPAADAPATPPAATQGAVAYNKTLKREKRPDGSVFVSLAEYPRTSRDPHGTPGYAAGDWFVDNLNSEPAIITPFLDKEATGNDVQVPVIESLLTRDWDTFEWLPLLAESYEQKADNVTFVFTLRKEATFSDGTPVTADDVVFSYKTMMDPGVDDDRYKASGSRIESCKKIDDRTVEFKFKDPYFQSLETAGGIGIIPQHVYKYDKAEDFNKKTDLLVGSGPYTFDKANWQRNQKLVLIRNENYWGNKWGEKPTFDRLVYVFIKNSQTAFQSFQAGDLDVLPPNPETWSKYSTDPAFLKDHQVRKYDRPNTGYTYVGWNESKPQFADAKTRTALTMLTDRPTMIKTIMRDLGHPITGPFSFMTPQNDATLPVIPYDPKAARKLLADAGWTLNDQSVLVRNGVEFRFDLAIGAGDPVTQQIAENIKTTFAKAGVIVNIAPAEFSVLVEQLDARNYDAAMLGWTGGVEEDPYQIWHSDSIKDKGSNFIAWKNPEADKLIEAGRKEMDDAKRMEIWHKLHKVIYDDQPYTFLWISSPRVFAQKRFENIDPYKLGINTSDWWVGQGQQKYK